MKICQVAAAGIACAMLCPPLRAQSRVYPAARQGGNYMHNYYFPPAPSSTPWAPAWSPDGKWIAVAMHGSIFRIDPETGSATELTMGSSYDSSPDWSPDGKWIVYTADEGHRRIQLRILNVTTGEFLSLTDDEQIYADPSFSPDGGRLACIYKAEWKLQYLHPADPRWTLGRRRTRPDKGQSLPAQPPVFRRLRHAHRAHLDAGW